MHVEVKFGSQKHAIEVAADGTLGDLKTAIHAITNVLPSLQKLLGKPGLQTKPDNSPLSTLGIQEGTKLMLIGSAAEAVVKANAPSGVEKQKEEERERRLRNLPHHFWRLPAYGGFLADPYVAGRGEPLEGGSAQLALLCCDVILCRLNTLGAGSHPNPSATSRTLLQALGQQGAASVSHPFLKDISAEQRTAIQRAHAVLRGCYDFTAEASAAVQPGDVLKVVESCVQRIEQLPVGEWMMLPSGWIGTTAFNIMFLLLHRRGPEAFELVVVNRGAEGQMYHPRWQTAEKIVSCPFLRFERVSTARLLDKSFWLLLLSLWMRRNDPKNHSEFIRSEVFYDVLLPWLVEKDPVERRPANADGAAAATSVSTRFPTEVILETSSTGGGEGAATAPFSPYLMNHAASPTCSASGGIKSAISAFCFLLERYTPDITATALKRIKYVLKYEFFVRAAEDLARYGKRFLPIQMPSSATPSALSSGTLSRPAAALMEEQRIRAALSRLREAGVNETATNTNLAKLLSEMQQHGIHLKDRHQKLLPESHFQNKMLLVYVGSTSVPNGLETSSMLADAAVGINKRYGNGVEFLFLSCDSSPEDYETHCDQFNFPRASFPCVKLLDAMELTSIPELLVFQSDGELLHRNGVSALRSDPEAAEFPNGPWKGAVPLSATDVRMLRFGAAQLAHHTKKRIDRGLAPATDDDVVKQVVELIHAVEAVVDELPRDDVQELVQPTSHVQSITATGVAEEALVPCSSENVDSMVQHRTDISRDASFPNTELLQKVSVAAYYGAPFEISVPSLPDIHDMKRATSYAELYTVLKRTQSVVEKLWKRAGSSGTASRVAVQLHIIELITWVFSCLVPVPLPQGYAVDRIPKEEQWCVAAFYSEDSLPAPPPPPPQQTSEAVASVPKVDPQFEMLTAVHYLMLSLANAWQAVETPTRSFDSERCLIGVDMLLVFDAILRQLRGSEKCQMIAQLLHTDGGYFLSTSQGRQTIPFEQVSATLQLTRPQLLPIRSAVLRYISHQKETCRAGELFDFRMPDKLELHKASYTVDFLKAVLANAGYTLDQSGGLFVANATEMDKLMEWLCSSRSPLANEHEEFLLMRNMTLLAKFMGTMEMRDAQLLHRRKELDPLASWRISFEEDAPGRQMSAGWRTRPRPPQWECLMVRGRDMDIADIVVKGFGDREVMYGEGLVLHSPIDVSRILEVDHPTEDDVLHAKSLPSFAGTMSQEESEILLSCLTAPYVRIPLVLDFFASQDRHTYLFVAEVQEVLRAVVFEPSAYVSSDRLCMVDPRWVPMRLSKQQREELELRHLRGDHSKQNYEDCLGTTYGLLLNELTHAPAGVLRPLRSLLESITELGPSSVYSSNASYVLYVVGLLCDVLGFCRFVRDNHSPVPSGGSVEHSEAEAVSRRQSSASLIDEYHRFILSFFTSTVQPLLWAWLTESESNTDTPTQCVIHAYLGRVDRTLWKGYLQLSPTLPGLPLASSTAAANAETAPPSSSPQEPGGSLSSEVEEFLVRMLQSYAFVRARHGFGMGMQRSQLAAQEGDELLTPEEKMLRFLQAQGLDTSRVSKELLEQGKQLMMSGGRRRAVFVQIRSRHYSDTVRVPNLVRSDPTSTTESKLLKLPPADVPENVLFCDLIDDHQRIIALLDNLLPKRRGEVLISIVQSVLRDHEPDAKPEMKGIAGTRRKRENSSSLSRSVSTRASTVNLDLLGGDEQVADSPMKAEWTTTTSAGIYRGPPSSGLLFHAQTCELFWRNDELKPVPDSMSHFTDFENILGKDALQCGLVSRHEHRHWVHIVGTPYDVVEWTAPPDPADQGVHHPFVIAGSWPAEPVESAMFENITYNRTVDISDENPWPVPEERWAVRMVRSVLQAAYPGEMKYHPLAPALPSAADDDEESSGRPMEAGASYRPPSLSCTATDGVHHDEMRFLMNDAPQYDGEAERATWKEVVAYRYPQPRLEVFNLVPHGRKMYRSLVFSTNQHFCLHSMALLSGPRTQETLAVSAFHAGELKRRIFNESTLEIHRYHEAIQGREVYIPARLLQGLIPSVLLESFFMWQGEDDVLRGYPLSEESEVASVTNDAATGSVKRKQGRTEVADHWFDYSIEVHLHVNSEDHARTGQSGTLPATSATSSASCVVVRRNNKSHSCISTLATTADRKAKEVNKASQGSAKRMMLQRATSVDRLDANAEDVLTEVKEDGNASWEEDHDGTTPKESEVALLHAALSHLPRSVCQALLQQSQADIAAALQWASSVENREALRELVVQHMQKVSASSGPSGLSHAEKASAAIESADYVLVNLLHCRHLSGLLEMLTRIEDCSHILVWGQRCGDDVVEPMDEEAAAHQLTVSSTGGLGRVQVEFVELPRLRVRFYTSTDGASARKRLYVADQPGWRLAEVDDLDAARWRRVRELQAPFQQCLLLCNSTHELAFMCPNHDFAPMKIEGDPFNPLLLFDRSSYTWREAVPSPFYLFALHSSNGFVTPPSLSASLYYAVMQCATQHYAGAIRTLESCYTDSPFSTEEGFMFSLFERTLADRFPDACAVRLKLAHAVQYSSNTYQWELAAELVGYLMTKRHIAEDCRLSRAEVVDLLKRCTQAVPMVRSQLELYAAYMKKEPSRQQAGKDAAAVVVASVKTPIMERCGSPWERLLLYPWEKIASQKLKRVTFHMQNPDEFSEENLVKSLWTDELLADEEGGANAKKGFYFLYSMKKGAVTAQLCGASAAVSLSQLLSRWFQLRHARWGREAQSNGETEAAPSWCGTVLQLMELFPSADWPDVAGSADRYILARGVTLTDSQQETEERYNVTLMIDESVIQRNRRGAAPEIFKSIHRVAQDLFKTSSTTEAIRTERQASRHRTPENRPLSVSMFDHLHGRIVPRNTALERVQLKEVDLHLRYFDDEVPEARHATLRALCSEPLSSLGFVGTLITAVEPMSSSAKPAVPSSPDSSSSSSLLPFDLRHHPLARAPLAQNMLDRLEEDSARFAAQQAELRRYYFACLSVEAVQQLLCATEVADMAVVYSQAVAVLQGCVTALSQMGKQDARRVDELRCSVLRLANTVHENVDAAARGSGRASGSSSEAHQRLVYFLQRAEASRVEVSLEWLCAGLLSTDLEAELHLVNRFHGPLSQLRAELVLLMLTSNRMYFAEQAAQAVQQLLLFLELCGLLRGYAATESSSQDNGGETSRSPSKAQRMSPAAVRARRIRELVQHFSLEVDPAHLERYEVVPCSTDNEEEGDLPQHGTHLFQLPEDALRVVRSRLHQLATTAIDFITAKRTYVHCFSDSPSLVAELDPRFLIFEFLFHILLRARQVEMVEWFVANIREGQSRVQQMIMGQGKTTVVGPLLALILADGAQLVTQVMPTALLEQTRGILRRCFGVVVTKHIYTIQFDRSNDDGTSDGVELLYQKLKSAEEDRSVVIAAPECVKSLFLKNIEQLHLIESVPTADMELDETADERYTTHVRALRKKMVERSAMADAITPILELWKRGVLIMDEVDVLLHPLRSELNFPIGLKHPIDMTGPRWLLPIHLLDGILACQHGRPSEDVQKELKFGASGAAEFNDASDEAAASAVTITQLRSRALNGIRSAILAGFRQRALQREPHLVLLDQAHYYTQQLLPALIPWLQLWLHSHLLSYLPEPEQQQFQFHGFDAFAEATAPFLSAAVKQSESVSATTLRLNRYMPDYGLQLLNLAHDWLHRLLPHVLAKIDRVSFGVLQPHDFALSGDVSKMPYSRKMMAVPFVAKDVPSRSSEFAHPDVVIGLTILAFRYEGLRVKDVRELVTQLKQDFARQAGPKEHRPAAKLYQHWLRLSSSDRSTAAQGGGSAAFSSAKGEQLRHQRPSAAATPTKRAASAVTATPLEVEDALQSFERAGVPLSQLQVTDRAQMQSLHHLLHRVPEAIHYYLCSTIFPRTMNFQRLKISACGHELGSSMLFTKRIGFSGTPSNLLPLDLGDCFYEPGSDGRVLSVLTNPDVAHAELLPDSWTPLRLLDRIAAAQPPYNALIDAGALITNMDNEEVARYLLARLPATLFDGVVFLDSRDRQMILQRDNGLVVPVAQCGVPLARRFTFFDQVHTTGTDVKQSATAVAVITFGKDLVFRDYAQGAYRMRGIGKGQRLCLYLIPEVVSRIEEALQSYRTGDLLRDVPAWLLLNSMKIEGLQFFKLSLQELANVWRKKAMLHLMHDSIFANEHASLFTAWMRCRRFQLDPPPVEVASVTATELKLTPAAATGSGSGDGATQLPSFSLDLLRASIQEFREIIDYPVPTTIAEAQSFSSHLKEILETRPPELIDGDAASQGLVQQLLERMRQTIDASQRAAASVTSEEAGGNRDSTGGGNHEADHVHLTMNLNAEIVHEQEAEEEQEQEAEQEEQRVSAFSRDDEQQIGWDIESLRHCGSMPEATTRPTHGCCFYQLGSFNICSNQPRLNVSSRFLMSDNYFRLDWHGVGERRLKSTFLFLEWVTEDSINAAGGKRADSIDLSKEVYSGLVTLAEGESLRWLLHHSTYVGRKFCLALRFASNGGYMDATAPFTAVVKRRGVQSLLRMPDQFASSPAAAEEAATINTTWPPSSALTPTTHRDAGFCDLAADQAALLYRFLNNDMFFSAAQLAVLEEVLVSVPPHDRLQFFMECLRVRRRSRNHWEDAPIAALFVTDAERPFLRQLAVGKRIEQGIAELGAIVTRAAHPRATTRQRREAGPVQQCFEALTTSLSQLISTSLHHGTADMVAAAGVDGVYKSSQNCSQSCGGGGMPRLTVGRAATLLMESFPMLFKTLSAHEVELALIFLVGQRHLREKEAQQQQQQQDRAAPEVEPKSGEEGWITTEELFALFPSLDAEQLRSQQSLARGAAGGAAGQSSGRSAEAVWTCGGCTFHNVPSSTVCVMCLTPRPKRTREEEPSSAAGGAMAEAAGGGGAVHLSTPDYCDPHQHEEEEEGGEEEDGPWQCEVCTFINDSRQQPLCAICLAPNPKPLKTGDGGGAGGAGGFDAMGADFECPEGYWVCSVEHGGCSKFNPNAVFYCQVCEKARPNLASVRF